MKRNRSDSFSSSAENQRQPVGITATSDRKRTTLLNHDVISEIARFVGIFGKDSSYFALIGWGWYKALVSLSGEWMDFQRGFGLPSSVWISETNSSSFNYRAAVVDSLKEAAKGDRSRILMEPVQFANRLLRSRTLDGTHFTLARTGHLRSDQLWDHLMHVLVNCVKVSFLSVLPLGIDSRILYRCSSLMSVDLAGLSSVRSIGNDFLCGCSSLTTVDLSGLSSVRSIGNSFLSQCKLLRSVDLTSLSSVAAIGDNFLFCCSSLTSVNLSGLSSVTAIGRDFLCYCRSLTSVDLAGLSFVTTVGFDFLYGCSSLTSVDLTGLNPLATIGDGFLAACPLGEAAEIAKRVFLEQRKRCLAGDGNAKS